MSEIQDLLQQIKSSAQKIKGQIHGLDDQIGTLEREREILRSARVSKADYLTFIKRDMTKAAEVFAQELRSAIGKDQRGWSGLERDLKNNYLNIPYMGLMMSAVPGVAMIKPGALCWFFGEQILQRIDDAVTDLNWPENVVPVEERQRRLAEIEARLAELNTQRDGLAKQLLDVGLQG